MMTITIVTIFPDFFESVLAQSILKRAQTSGSVEFNVLDLRTLTTDKHHTTDDRPFGGGPGMVMKVEPIYRAVEDIKSKFTPNASSKVVLTSAKGSLFTQQKAQQYSQLDNLVIICGHYEGVDERVAQHIADEEVRIGDYVLTGGEPAAAVMADAITRLIPGVLGNESSNVDESHSQPGVLGYPQYTRPEEFMGWKAPAGLLSGDHAEIKRWRGEQRKTE